MSSVSPSSVPHLESTAADARSQVPELIVVEPPTVTPMWIGMGRPPSVVVVPPAR